MRAERAAQRAILVLHEFGARLDAGDIEDRAYLIALELGVGIIGVTNAGDQPVEETAAQRQLAAQIGAELTKVDRNGDFSLLFLGFFALLTFLTMVMTCAGARGHTIASVVPTDRGTQIAVAREEREARVRAPGARIAVGQHTALVGGFAQLGGLIEVPFGFFLVSIGQQIGAQGVGHYKAGD